MRKLVLVAILVLVAVVWSSGVSALPVVVKNIATGIDDSTGEKIAYLSSDTDYLIGAGSTEGVGLVNLTYANLSYATLTSANLPGADLSFASLNNANLYFATLNNSDLHGADLSYVNLYGANLNYANLSYANLAGAYLVNANLNNANLVGANLTGAKELDSAHGIPEYDALTDFTGTGFDPVAAGWNLIPEPSTALLVGIGLAGMAARRRV